MVCYNTNMEKKDVLYEIQNKELYQKALEQMPEENDIFDLADFFKVMGDSTRLKLLMALESGEFLCQ